MTVKIKCFEDAQSVIAAASPFLAARPVEHNLLATLLGQRLAKPEPAQFWLARGGDGGGDRRARHRSTGCSR